MMMMMVVVVVVVIRCAQYSFVLIHNIRASYDVFSQLILQTSKCVSVRRWWVISVCLSVCLSVSAYLSVCLSVCLSVLFACSCVNGCDCLSSELLLIHRCAGTRVCVRAGEIKHAPARLCPQTRPCHLRPTAIVSFSSGFGSRC